MQNSEDTRLYYILAAIKALNIRLPNAEIVKKTGISKSQLSATLNGDIPVSDNFLNKFKGSFNYVPHKTDKSEVNLHKYKNW